MLQCQFPPNKACWMSGFWFYDAKITGYYKSLKTRYRFLDSLDKYPIHGKTVLRAGEKYAEKNCQDIKKWRKKMPSLASLLRTLRYVSDINKLGWNDGRKELDNSACSKSLACESPYYNNDNESSDVQWSREDTERSPTIDHSRQEKRTRQLKWGSNVRMTHFLPKSEKLSSPWINRHLSITLSANSTGFGQRRLLKLARSWWNFQDRNLFGSSEAFHRSSDSTVQI